MNILIWIFRTNLLFLKENAGKENYAGKLYFVKVKWPTVILI